MLGAKFTGHSVFLSLGRSAASDLAPFPPSFLHQPLLSPLPTSFWDTSFLAPSGLGSCSSLFPISHLYFSLDFSHHRCCWSIQPSLTGLRPEYPTNPCTVDLCTIRYLRCNLLQIGHLPQACSSSHVTFQRVALPFTTPRPDTQDSALTSSFSLCPHPLRS